MADARLRVLLHAPADAGQRARVLRERVRSGSLSTERLRLLAHAGCQAAGLALGEPPAAADDLAAWAAGFAAWGDVAQAQAALAVAGLAVPLWEAWEPGEFGPGDCLRRALAAARSWLGEGRERDAAEARLVEARGVLDAAAQLLGMLDAEHPSLIRPQTWRALEAGWLTAEALRAAHVHRDRSSPVRGRRPRDAAYVLGEGVRLFGLTRVRGALVDELSG